MEPRRHRRLQIREHRSSLLTARRHHRPDPLAPPVPALAPRPLRDPPVDHHEPDRLLRQVVRRLDLGRREEPEILPWHRRNSYEPDAPARGVPQSPRWRVGLVCARMRNFLAGVIALPVRLQSLGQIEAGPCRRHVARPAPQHLGPRRLIDPGSGIAALRRRHEYG